MSVEPATLSDNENIYWQQHKQTEESSTSNEDTDVADAEATDVKEQKRPIIDVQTSIRYLQSKAYKTTYGNSLVWEPYRRNHKGARPSEKTRKTCIRGGVISTGNPCPVCRDEYLVLHPENVQLLKQFISPQTGTVLSYQKTGVCQKQHRNLLVAIQKAWDMGLIEMPLTFRRYDYEEYYPQATTASKTK